MMHEESAEAAKEIGLRYSTDRSPGYTRKHKGRKFEFVDVSGHSINHPQTLRRIAALVIPPAWNDVWICPNPQGYLQATGKDAKGRRQAIYHPEWRAHRDEAKFQKLAKFGQALPKLRSRVDRDLAQHGLPKSKVVAAVVSLLEKSLIRVGNRQYVRENESFGLTTLENRHADISSTSIKFSFKGKSGKYHEITLTDRRLAGIVRRCQELPGQALFEYLDSESQPGEISSNDINNYIQEATGGEFTAKDFRTWIATVEAVRLIMALENPTDRYLKEVVKQVAKRLGNTPTVCRTSYIHPAVLARPADWLSNPAVNSSNSARDPVEGFVLRHVLK